MLRISRAHNTGRHKTDKVWRRGQSGIQADTRRTRGGQASGTRRAHRGQPFSSKREPYSKLFGENAYIATPLKRRNPNQCLGRASRPGPPCVCHLTTMCPPCVRPLSAAGPPPCVIFCPPLTGYLPPCPKTSATCSPCAHVCLRFGQCVLQGPTMRPPLSGFLCSPLFSSVRPLLFSSLFALCRPLPHNGWLMLSKDAGRPRKALALPLDLVRSFSKKIISPLRNPQRLYCMPAGQFPGHSF